jgi:hypothetical protein
MDVVHAVVEIAILAGLVWALGTVVWVAWDMKKSRCQMRCLDTSERDRVLLEPCWNRC